jgi:type IV pilus assembly protein PilY1
VPVKVRWCSDKLLTQCQGKRVGSFIYPSYSAPAGAIASYGTIAIGASSTATSLNITNIAIAESGGSVNITSGTMTAATGTNTAQAADHGQPGGGQHHRAQHHQPVLCLREDADRAATVPACSVFGITLTADNVVAVVPVTCTGTKSLTNCVTVTDSSRAGWGFTVSANSVRVAPAYVTFSGTTASSGSPAMGATSYNATSLFSSMSIGRNQTAAQVAALFIARSAPAAPTRPMPAATPPASTPCRPIACAWSIAVRAPTPAPHDWRRQQCRYIGQQHGRRRWTPSRPPRRRCRPAPARRIRSCA